MEDAGRYVVFGEIASGGMAKVHLGRLVRPAGFSRTVAVKRLHNMLARDPEFVAMFLDEARVAARVTHPNVVPTLDIVAIDDELLLIMEYVEGESLARLIRGAMSLGETVPPAFAANILAGALHGLHAAHEAKDGRGAPLEIVHRDVSPQNILVGVDGVARVLDFGVAKAVGRTQATKDGSLKGKLGYMAPEQFEGKATRQTDIYAASVVLWEALTAKRLFGADDQAKNIADILTAELTLPSELVPGISPELEAIVMKGCARRPEDRFATAKEMALALEAAVATVPASAVGTWVERVAEAALGTRATMVREIEDRVTGIESKDVLVRDRAQVAKTLEGPGGQTVTLIVPASGGNGVPASVRGPASVPGLGSSASATPDPSPSPPSPPAGGRRWHVPVAVVVTAALTGTIAALWPRSAPSVTPASAATSTSAIGAAPSAEVSAPSPAPSDSTEPAPPAAPGARSSILPVVSATPHARPPRLAPAKNCTPPYREVLVDGHVRRVPKRECL